jgi:hypothetical protein
VSFHLPLFPYSSEQALEDEEWVEVYPGLVDQQFWVDPAEGVRFCLPLMRAAALAQIVSQNRLFHAFPSFLAFLENIHAGAAMTSFILFSGRTGAFLCSEERMVGIAFGRCI